MPSIFRQDIKLMVDVDLSLEKLDLHVKFQLSRFTSVTPKSIPRIHLAFDHFGAKIKQAGSREDFSIFNLEHVGNLH